MIVLQKGHRYSLAHRGGTEQTIIQYFNGEPGQEAEGVLQQEILRMMLDRNRYCNNCLPHPDNEKIQYHLRMVLALHEGRALQRKVEKGELNIEYVPTGEDGHLEFNLSKDIEMKNLSTTLLPPPPREGICNYNSADSDL